MGEEVGLGGGEGVGREAEGAGDTAGAAVAGGEDVDVGVADHDGCGGGDERRFGMSALASAMRVRRPWGSGFLVWKLLPP